MCQDRLSESYIDFSPRLLFFPCRVLAWRGRNSRNQREKRDEPICRPAAEDPGESDAFWLDFGTKVNEALNYYGFVKLNMSKKKRCRLHIQKETNGVVTMKIIPNPQSRSQACEVTWAAVTHTHTHTCLRSCDACSVSYFCVFLVCICVSRIRMSEPRKMCFFTIQFQW